MNPNGPQSATGCEATGRNPNYQPHTASDFLEKASETLGERGKQYDPNGKQERSMTAICAAFNAIYPATKLTVHMGWQFMGLVKMVRGATKPHADSALDQVAYAALAAECVAEALHQPAPTVQPAQLVNPCELGMAAQVAAEPYVAPMIGGQTDYERWQGAEAALRHMRASKNVFKSMGESAANRVEQLLAQVAEYQHTNQALADKLAAQQELLNVAQHNANFYFDKTNTEYSLNRELRANLEAQGRLVAELKDELASRAAHYAPLEQHVRSLEIQNDTLRSSFSQYACRFDLDKEYMTKGQVLAVQATHDAQVSKLQAASRMDVRTINELRAELETVRGECISRGAQLDEFKAKRELKSVECLRKICYIASTFPSQVHAVVQEVITSYGFGHFYQASEANWKGQPESPVAHNTDEPKAAQAMAPYADPYDNHGDVQPKPLHRTVGSADPARAPAPSFGMSSGEPL